MYCGVDMRAVSEEDERGDLPKSSVDLLYP
jgi:hypothetical protein